MASHPSQRNGGYIRDSTSSLVLRRYIKRGQERRGRGGSAERAQPDSREAVKRGEENVDTKQKPPSSRNAQAVSGISGEWLGGELVRWESRRAGVLVGLDGCAS